MTSERRRWPWTALPSSVSDELRPQVDHVTADVIDAVAGGVAAYSQPIEGRFGRGLVRGVRVALERFVDLPGTDLPPLSDEDRAVYLRLGRGELRQGRSVDSLMAAYRQGAQLCLRRFSHLIAERGYDMETVIALSESVLTYIDALSAVSVEGYSQALSSRASQLARWREELVREMLSPAADESNIREAAALLSWRVPTRVVVGVVPAEHAAAVERLTGPDAIVAQVDTETLLVIPVWRTELKRARWDDLLRGRDAVLGPVREVTHAADSLRVARRALALRATLSPTPDANDDAPAPDDGNSKVEEREEERTGRRSKPGEQSPPVWAADWTLDLALGADPGLIADLRRETLDVLDELPAGRRARTVETLHAWLDHRGQRSAMAEALDLHPQTVGYRVSGLHTVFGDRLENPQWRLAASVLLELDRAQARVTRDA